mmetsp:Transcript_121109/g.241245  ORF Transcript_121109/g.241245 Transcript_121109/m.241245 type:complete len:173 (+) Transcript_121109:45-563(+)
MEAHESKDENAEAPINCKPLNSDERKELGGCDFKGESWQASLERMEVSQQVLTTVVVRNVPRNVTVGDFWSELQLLGFQNFVTLVNLPEDRKKGQNRGYAFVNFLTPDSGFCFRKAMNGHHWHEHSGAATADWAIVQGHDANAALAQETPSKRQIRPKKKYREQCLIPVKGA